MVRRAAFVLLLASSPALAQDDGAAAWKKIYQVLSHTRCTNCHVGADNTPIWSGLSYGKEARPHGMYINAGKGSDDNAPRVGADFIPCSACHSVSNSQLPHGPPGAPHMRDGDPEWSFPPPSMQWSGKLSADICKQIASSNSPFLQSPAKFADHVKSGLVSWAWEPGPGRDGVPPVEADALIASFREWDAAHRPCPTE